MANFFQYKGVTYTLINQYAKRKDMNRNWREVVIYQDPEGKEYVRDKLEFFQKFKPLARIDVERYSREQLKSAIEKTQAIISLGFKINVDAIIQSVSK